MNTTTEIETKEREFDAVVALYMIGEDKFMSGVFSKIGDNFSLYITQAKEGIFASVDFVEEIYTDIILQNDGYIERYDFLTNSTTLDKLITNVVADKKPSTSMKFKNEIEADAKKNGETDRHRAGFKLNELKNIQKRYRNLVDKDYLTDSEYRTMKASIETMMVKCRPLLEKKYKKNRE